MSVWGSATEHERASKRIKDRRKCPFCQLNRVTHVGLANEVALCRGCEFCIARWVKNGYEAFGL